MKKRFRQAQEVRIDELPKDVRAAVVGAVGRPVIVTMPATAPSFEKKLAELKQRSSTRRR